MTRASTEVSVATHNETQTEVRGVGVMDGFRSNPQYTSQPMGNIMFPGGYIQGMPQIGVPQQMVVPQQMMPTQLALMTQPQPQRKDVKPKVMC